MTKRNKKKSGNIKFFETIKSHFLLFFIILVICGGLGFGISKFINNDLYKASAKVYISCTDYANAIKEENANIPLSEKLAYIYLEVIKSDDFIDKLINELDYDEESYIDAKEYKEIIDLAPLNDTDIMLISITLNDAEKATEIVNTLATLMVDELPWILDLDDVYILSTASVPTKPIETDSLNFTLYGLGLGFLICLLIAVCSGGGSNKTKLVSTNSEIKAIFSYPFIGTISSEINDD